MLHIILYCVMQTEFLMFLIHFEKKFKELTLFISMKIKNIIVLSCFEQSL